MGFLAYYGYYVQDFQFNSSDFALDFLTAQPKILISLRFVFLRLIESFDKHFGQSVSKKFLE